jgi:hypothetical protein
MSEDFDDLLSGAVDSAAGAARKPGAAEARKRGGRRRTRQRLAASTLAVVLLGGIGSAAAVSLGHTAGTPAASATGTASASPAPAGSVSTGPSTGPAPSQTPSLSHGSSTTPTGSPDTSATTSTSPGTTGSPNSAFAVETWLTASQVPFDGAMNWTAGSPGSCTGSLVFSPYYAGGCSEHTVPGAAHPATRMDTLILSSTGVATGDGAWIAPTAAQTFYTYPDAADAQSAYQYFTGQIRDEDAQFKGGVAVNTGLPLVSTTTVTVQTADAMAVDHTLRDSHGNPAQVDGNPGGYSDVHFFFAVKGDLVEVLQISGGPSVSDTSQDGPTLATVVSAIG